MNFFKKEWRVGAENVFELNSEINQLTKLKPWLIVGFWFFKTLKHSSVVLNESYQIHEDLMELLQGKLSRHVRQSSELSRIIQ
jgi:hypothetical protein